MSEWSEPEKLPTEPAGKTRLFGTLLAWMAAIYNYILIEILKWFGIPFRKLKGVYAFLLRSPLVLLFWSGLCIVMVVYNLALWVIITVAAFWAILYEYPMDLLSAHDIIEPRYPVKRDTSPRRWD